MATGKSSGAQGGAGGSRSGGPDAGAVQNEGAFRDPDEWKTGDEPMTASQRSYLRTLATEAGVEPADEGLTKAEAAKRIEELQRQTGRGTQGH